MIDAIARTQLAEAIRALASGVITNDEFETRVPRGSLDPAVQEIFLSGPWQLYSDLRTHKLSGQHRLPDLARPEVSRWVLFLKSSRPYDWPRYAGPQGLLWLISSLLTFGLFGIIRRRRLAHHGDLSVWPFIHRKHFEAALAARPPYLGGAA